MRIAPSTIATPIAALDAAGGRTFATMSGVDKLTGQNAPMQVYSRGLVGRLAGYASISTALSAARTLSRGEEKAAVTVTRRDDGRYDINEAVWRYGFARLEAPGERAPYRRFHFEDGTPSAYTAWTEGRKLEINAALQLGLPASTSAIALVDGSRVLELPPVR
ncbi:MAG: hypothetical protein JWM90_2280 [Thermoleophilia bacterium]|nr:hypothetical protein [Thermoleophilia bacterium]